MMIKLRYALEPNLIVSNLPKYATMTTELFGHIKTVYVNEDTYCKIL